MAAEPLGSRLLAPGVGTASQGLGICALGVGSGSHRRRRMLGSTQALAWWEGAPGAGMSRRSKLVLGLSVVLTAATVAGVHLNQRQDRQVGVT